MAVCFFGVFFCQLFMPPFLTCSLAGFFEYAVQKSVACFGGAYAVQKSVACFGDARVGPGGVQKSFLGQLTAVKNRCN